MDKRNEQKRRKALSLQNKAIKSIAKITNERSDIDQIKLYLI